VQKGETIRFTQGQAKDCLYNLEESIVPAAL